MNKIEAFYFSYLLMLLIAASSEWHELSVSTVMILDSSLMLPCSLLMKELVDEGIERASGLRQLIVPFGIHANG